MPRSKTPRPPATARDKAPWPPEAALSADRSGALLAGRDLEGLMPLLDALPFYVLLIDSAHTILAANHAVQKDLNCCAADLIGWDCPRAVHGTEGPYPGCPLEEAVKTGAGVEREHYDSKGERWIESMVYPLTGRSAQGRPVYLHLVRDITSRKLLEQELRAMKDALEAQVKARTAELEQAYEQLAERHRVTESLRDELEKIATTRERLARVGELSAGVAHSIRNPLHGLSNCVDLLRGRVAADDAVADEVLTFMADGLRRIDVVTQRLLALTRDAPVRRQPTSVDHLVESALAFVQGRLGGKALQLETQLAEVPPLQLDGDRLVEALVNLLDNAIDASPPAGRIVIRTRLSSSQPRTLLLEVQDAGHGIPPELLQRVFDPFFTTKAVGEGSGLGLAITRRAVEAHGGEVAVDSRPQEGTLVRVTLPLVVSAADAPQQQDDERR